MYSKKRLLIGMLIQLEVLQLVQGHLLQLQIFQLTPPIGLMQQIIAVPQLELQFWLV